MRLLWRLAHGQANAADVDNAVMWGWITNDSSPSFLGACLSVSPFGDLSGKAQSAIAAAEVPIAYNDLPFKAFKPQQGQRVTASIAKVKIFKNMGIILRNSSPLKLMGELGRDLTHQRDAIQLKE
jgi:hypothetical protein